MTGSQAMEGKRELRTIRSLRVAQMRRNGLPLAQYNKVGDGLSCVKTRKNGLFLGFRLSRSQETVQIGFELRWTTPPISSFATSRV